MFIATEASRQLDEALIPDEVATTVVTLAELHRGVLTLESVAERAAKFIAIKPLQAITQSCATVEEM